MKQILIILFFIPVLSYAQVYNRSSLSFNTITDLSARIGENGVRVTVKGYHSATDNVPTVWVWSDTSTATPGVGTVIKVGSVQPGRWLRIITYPLNLKEFGAKGIGLAGIDEDTTAIRAAIEVIRTNGRGSLYVPPSTSFYAFAGKSISVPNNCEIFGDGLGKGIIRHVAPTTSIYPGAIFTFSTYGADSVNGLFQSVMKPFTYNVNPQNLGDSFVVLQDASKAAQLFVGEIIFVGCSKYYHSDNVGKPRYIGECHEISEISNDTVVFTSPLAVNLIADTAQPKLINLNNNGTWNVTSQEVNHTTKNITIHDLTLQQAQRDELEDTAINRRLAGVWANGGVYNAHFYNLDIDAYNGIGGNLYSHVELDHINLSEERHMFDAGFDSYDISVHDINYIFKNSDVSDFAAALVVLNDGFHNGRIYNNKIFGTRSIKNIFNVSDAWNVTIDNNSINFPNYQADNIAFNVGDGDRNNVAVHDLNITNNTVVVNKIGMFMRLAGDTTENTIYSNRHILVSNNTFFGSKYYEDSSFASNAFYIRRMKGVIASKNVIPEGDYYLEDEDSLRVNYNNAPNNKLVFVGTKVGTKFNYNTFLSCDSTTIPTESVNYIAGNAIYSTTQTVTYPITNVTSNYTVLSTDQFLRCNATSGNITVTMPAPSSDNKRHFWYIKKFDNSANTVTITGTINGVSGYTLSRENQFVMLYSNASSYDILGKGFDGTIGSAGANNQTYGGTDSWDGTPPNTAVSKTYSWSQMGNVVLLQVQIKYSGAGATNTTVTLTWPSGAPLPLEPTTFNNTGDNMVIGRGLLGVNTSANNTNGSAAINKTGSGTYQIIVNGNSVSAKTLWVSLMYLATTSL